MQATICQTHVTKIRVDLNHDEYERCDERISLLNPNMYLLLFVSSLFKVALFSYNCLTLGGEVGGGGHHQAV